MCDKEEYIRFWWRHPDLCPDTILFFEVILHHWEMVPKWYTAWHLKTLWTDYDKTWWMSWGGDKNKLIWFGLRSPCRSCCSSWRWYVLDCMSFSLFTETIILLDHIIAVMSRWSSSICSLHGWFIHLGESYQVNFKFDRKVVSPKLSTKFRPNSSNFLRYPAHKQIDEQGWKHNFCPA